MTETDYYAVLGASPGDGFAELKRAYYRRAQSCHPDHHGNSAAHTAEFRMVVEAFRILSDPAKRAEYDALRVSSSVPKNVPRGKKRRSAFDHADSVLDTEADDILEELIVGNDPPAGTTLMTLFEDLEKTRVFMMWLEARDAWGRGDYRNALPLFKRLAGLAPGNILYRVFLARTHASLGNWSNSLYHYRAAIRIGSMREPPQELRGVKKELDRTEKKSHPVFSRIRKFFAPEPDAVFRDPAEEMRCSTGRAMERMYRQALDDGEITEDDSPKRLE